MCNITKINDTLVAQKYLQILILPLSTPTYKLISYITHYITSYR